MTRFPARWFCRPVVTALVSIAVLSWPVRAQRFNSMLAETRGQLDALRFCLGMNFLPLQALEVGLLRGYDGPHFVGGGHGGDGQWEPPPPPAEYSRSLEDDVKACVESATGRSVITILSATRLNPDLSAEIFLLEPDGLLPSDDRGQQARTRASELGEESKAVIAQALHVLAQTDARHKSEESGDGAQPPPPPPAAD